MAYALGAIDSDWQAAFEADLPAFLVNSLDTADNARWVQGTLWTDTNLLNSFNPPSDAYNGCPWDYSLAAIPSGTNTFSIILGFDTAIDVDLVAVQLTSTLQIDGTCTFSFSVANDSTGAPGTFTTLYSTTWSSSTRRKGFFLDSGGNHQLLSDADWLRFTWTNLTFPPYVGELWAGVRIQMPSRPQRPFNPLPKNSSKEFGSVGSRPRVVRNLYSGFQDYAMTFLAANYADPVYSINGLTQARRVYTETNYGRKPLVFWWSPYNDLDGFQACILQNEPDFSLQGPFHAVPSFDLAELGPQELTE